MDIRNIQECANYFKDTYIESFYLIVTYNGNGFILVAEKENFPHLMGISQQTYRSNGYGNPKKLYKDILEGVNINRRIIPHSIATTSKMYRKILNFTHNNEVLLENKCPIILRYNSTLSNLRLNNVDLLISDLNKGYMLGWIFNTQIPINASIKISKYCISSWIDESGGTISGKEKYMPNQDIELIRSVLVFDKNSELIRRKEYKYSKQQKLQILDACYRNNCNLLLDSRNEKKYIDLAKQNNIPCTINGVVKR